MTEWWRAEGWPTAEEWTALWAFAAVVLTALLLWVAWRQLAGLAASNSGLAESNRLLAESNRALSRPSIVVEFAFEKVPWRNYTQTSNVSTVFVVVKNVGASPAMNVRMSVSPAFEATDKKITPEVLAFLNARFDGQSVVRMIAPAQRLKYILDSAKDAVGNEDLPGEYTITAVYEDLEGSTFGERFVLQMSPWAISVAETDPLRQLSKDVQFISENLRSSSYGLPKVASSVRALADDPEASYRTGLGRPRLRASRRR